MSGDERELKNCLYIYNRKNLKQNELFEVGRLGFDLGSGQVSKAILSSIL